MVSLRYATEWTADFRSDKRHKIYEWGVNMRDIVKKCAVELSWNEVCNIVAEEIKDILGVHVQCRVIISEDTYWDITFIGYRLPLSKLYQLAQALHATSEDLEDTRPTEDHVDVNCIGMALSEKLIGRHLKLTWEHHLITEDSLWLVGVTEAISS